MHPTLISWNGVGLHTWGLMITVAFAAAILVTAGRARTIGVDPDKLVPIYVASPILGLAGARLLHFLFAEPELFFKHPMAYFDMGQGGFAFYGGVILAAFGGLLYAHLVKLPLLKVADLCAPNILLGLMFGRIGCFFAGCCHGAATGAHVTGTLITLQGGAVVTVAGFPYVALIYVPHVGVGDLFHVPLYPTQPWEALGACALFLFLSWWWKTRRAFDGQVAGLALVLYAFLRYTVESFRGDTIRGVDYFDLFSTSQLVSFGGLALGVLMLVGLRGRGVAPETPIVHDDDDPDL